MRGRRHELRVWAFLDGALEGAERDRIEQLIEADPDTIRTSRHHRNLSNGIRAAWTEGPPAPDPENLLASIRSEMTRIDAEIAERPTLFSTIGALREALRPLRVPVLAGTAAAVAFLMYVSLPVGSLTGSGSPSPQAGAPITLAQETIYDLESDEGSVMIVEAEEGATIIYVVDERDGIAKQPLPSLDWSEYLREGLA